MDGRLNLGLIAVAIAIVIGGISVGAGFSKFRTGDRYVTVKGVAEREVKADLALWPISFTSTDDDLGAAQTKSARAHRTVMAFLGGQGVDSASVELQGFQVTDALANPYRTGPVTSRYTIVRRLMVRSSDPDLIMAASQQVAKLVDAGVVLSSGEYGAGGPTFLFTRLNDVKPDMIAEATAQARTAAGRFAQDSKSRIGGIRQANQGVFSILPRDQAPGIQESSQLYKVVRVVSTLDYFLRD
jgi:hypothetical protein